MRPLKISKKTKAYISLALVLLCTPVMAKGEDLSQVIRLANQGNAQAQSNLGVMYYEGKGVRQDYQKAVEWYTKAANQGDADAQHNLGLRYYNGEGVRQDYQKAFEWYTKAADQGDASAQNSLGVMYYEGEGVRQDYRKAKERYGKACDNGLQEGCDAYKKLNQRGF